MMPASNTKAKLDRALVEYANACGKGAGAVALQQKAKAQIQQLTAQIPSPGMLELISRFLNVCQECAKPSIQSASVPMADLFKRHVELGLVRSAEALYLLALEFGRIPAWVDSIEGALSPKCLEAAVKAKVISKKDLEDRVLKNLPSSYQTALADWFISKASIPNLVGMARIALARTQRPAILPTYLQVIQRIVARDKQFKILTGILRETPDDILRIGTYGEVCMQDGSLVFQFSDAILRLMKDKKAAGNLGRVVQMLADEAVGPRRTMASLCIARITAGILLTQPEIKIPKEQIEALLGLTERLKGIVREPPEAWLLARHPATEPPVSGRGLVSKEGAQRVVLAHEQLGRGLDAGGVLSSLAHNLGLVTRGSVGERLPFDPMQHEDVEGGLLRGDPCQVVGSGWSLGSEVITRTKVRPEGSADA